MSDSSDVARPEKYSSEELAVKALELQDEFPLSSEGAICGKLRVGREYIADRAKTSPVVKEAREVMATIRMDAWEQLGIKIITMPAQMSNATAFIFQTKNILGWRNEAAAETSQPDDKSKGIRLKYRLDDKGRGE